MAAGIAFDNDKYMKEQTGEILDRVKRFDDKLYLEFGGKLLFDYHEDLGSNLRLTFVVNSGIFPLCRDP